MGLLFTKLFSWFSNDGKRSTLIACQAQYQLFCTNDILINVNFFSILLNISRHDSVKFILKEGILKQS